MNMTDNFDFHYLGLPMSVDLVEYLPSVFCAYAMS